MQGLPEGIGPLAVALVALGAVLGVAFMLWVRRPLEATFAAAGPTGRTVAATVALALGLGVGAAPYLTWRVVEDVRYTSELDPWLVERYGVSVFEVHPAVYDRAAALIPRDATYALRTDPRIERTRRAAFEQWALTTLLPRRAVSNPADARWLLTLGVRPEAVDPRVVRTIRLHPGGQGVPPSYAGELPA